MDILVADDNPVFRDVLDTMLRQWGYNVVVTGDGEEAWRLLQATDAPRLIILDWTMPGWTAWRFAGGFGKRAVRHTQSS